MAKKNRDPKPREHEEGEDRGIIEPKIIRVNIDSIKVGERIRKDLGDITSLALAIRLFRWVDYPVVDEDMNLVAGRRRYEALRKNGEKTIWVQQIPKELAKVIEVLENVLTKKLNWDEYVEGVYALHEYLTKNANMIISKKTWQKWTQADTARLLGITKSTLSDILKLRRSSLWPQLKEKCNSLDEALKALNKALSSGEEEGEEAEEEEEGEEVEEEEKPPKSDLIKSVQELQRKLTILEALTNINNRMRRMRMSCPICGEHIDLYKMKLPCGHTLADVADQIMREYEKLRKKAREEGIEID